MLLPGWLNKTEWPFACRERRVHGGVLRGVEEGEGPTVVLVHGTPTWSYDWRRVITALAGSYRVVAYDHLGFGLSDRPRDVAYSPEAHAVRFAELMAEVAPSERVHLVVHDFGGPIALDWALTNVERLASLTVVNSWMWSFEGDPVMGPRAKMIDGFVGKWMYRRLNASLRLIMPSAFGERRKLTRALHEQYLSVFPDADSRERVLFALAKALGGSSAFYESLWQRREVLKGVPMSILWGLADSAFTPPILERWKVAFPHAAVTTWPKAGHWPHEEEPEAFVAALQKHLGAASTLGAS